MKKKIAFLAHMLLTLCLTVTAAQAASPTVSIAQLHDSVSAYWDGEYEAHGRTISFHAPVYVPDVEKMPVLTVTGNTAEDMSCPDGLVLKNDSLATQSVGKATSIGRMPCWPHYFNFPWSQEGRRDAETCYAENNSTSLAVAIDDVQNIVDAIWGEGVYGVFPDLADVGIPIRRKNGEYYDYSNTPGMEAYTGKGVYMIYARLMIRGIPVIMGASCGFEVPDGGQAMYIPLGFPAELTVAFYLEPGNYQLAIACSVFKETGVMIEDIPLCPFGDVQKEVERLIEKGSIRDVHSMQLGYVVYQKRDAEYDYDKKALDQMIGAEYVAVPTWIVECTYAKNAKAKITTAPEPENGEEIA